MTEIINFWCNKIDNKKSKNRNKCREYYLFDLFNIKTNMNKIYNKNTPKLDVFFNVYFTLNLYTFLFYYMLYVVTLLIPEASGSIDELLKKCDTFLKVCKQNNYGMPFCLVSKSVPFYKLYSYCKEMNKSLHKHRFVWGKSLLYKPDADVDLPTPQKIDEEFIRNCLQYKRKTELIEYIGSLAGYATQENTYGDWLFHQLHEDLLQVFYVCLHEKNIEAHAVFSNESIREKNMLAERSMMDMLQFVEILFDQITTLEKRLQTPYKVVNEVKEYIKTHFREDMSREQISAAVYITPNYLSKLFRSETGMTLREYINNCRIQEAKRLLSHTDLSVSEIAFELGFESMSYFSTVFRKICGVSPIAWKNSK